MATKEEKEASKEALKIVRELIKKDTKPMDHKNLMPGNLVFYTYDAKDKTKRYDRTPMVLVLRASQSYVLGLNFHYLPVVMRRTLFKFIMKKNKKIIDANKRIIFTYNQLKPFLSSLGYAPVVRLYIKKRISKRGVVIPFELIPKAIELRVETFIEGSPSSEVLYKRNLRSGK